MSPCTNRNKQPSKTLLQTTGRRITLIIIENIHVYHTAYFMQKRNFLMEIKNRTDSPVFAFELAKALLQRLGRLVRLVVVPARRHRHRPVAVGLRSHFARRHLVQSARLVDRRWQSRRLRATNEINGKQRGREIHAKSMCGILVALSFPSELLTPMKKFTQQN